MVRPSRLRRGDHRPAEPLLGGLGDELGAGWRSSRTAAARRSAAPRRTSRGSGRPRVYSCASTDDRRAGTRASARACACASGVVSSRWSRLTSMPFADDALAGAAPSGLARGSSDDVDAIEQRRQPALRQLLRDRPAAPRCRPARRRAAGRPAAPSAAAPRQPRCCEPHAAPPAARRSASVPSSSSRTAVPGTLACASSASAALHSALLVKAVRPGANPACDSGCAAAGSAPPPAAHRARSRRLLQRAPVRQRGHRRRHAGAAGKEQRPNAATGTKKRGNGSTVRGFVEGDPGHYKRRTFDLHDATGEPAMLPTPDDAQPSAARGADSLIAFRAATAAFRDTRQRFGAWRSRGRPCAPSITVIELTGDRHVHRHVPRQPVAGDRHPSLRRRRRARAGALRAARAARGRGCTARSAMRGSR